MPKATTEKKKPARPRIRIRPAAPIPVRIRRGPKRKYPIDRLRVGESIRVPATYNCALVCCKAFIRIHEPSWRFKVIKIADRVADIWRVK